MKKFLLLKLIIIFMTKDIFGSSFDTTNSQKFESSQKESNPTNNNDMMENSHVIDNETTTENIPEFGSTFERLKDVMVDYIKANGKRPMTHEFNKNSKKIIDYLNFLLEKTQPGVMRNQIEDIVNKMNAMLEQNHGYFPSADEYEEQSEEFSEKELGGFGYLLESEIEHLMNSKIIEENLEIFKNIEEKLDLNFEDILSRMLIDLFLKLFNVKDHQNLINIITNLLHTRENGDDINDNLSAPLIKFFKNLILQKFMNLLERGQGMNPGTYDQNVKQNFVNDHLQNFFDQIFRNFKTEQTPKMLNLEKIITKLKIAERQFLNPKAINQNSWNLMPQILRNLQIIPNSNIEQILSSLNSPKSQNYNNGPINQQRLTQKLPNVIKQIISEYLKAIILLIKDRLLKSRHPALHDDPYINSKLVKNLRKFVEHSKEEVQIKTPSATEQQRGFETKNPQSEEFKSTEDKSAESNDQTNEIENTIRIQENLNCTDCSSNNTDFSNFKTNPIFNVKTNQSNISPETPESNNEEEIKISNQENEQKIKNSQEASNCTDCGHYDNSTIHSQEISTENKRKMLIENLNCTDCGYDEKSANYSQQVAESDAEMKTSEEEVKIKNQEVEEENLNSEKTMPGSSTEHEDVLENNSRKSLENFTENQRFSIENPDESIATQQNLPENYENFPNSLQSSTEDPESQPTTSENFEGEKHSETSEEFVTEINETSAGTEDLPRNIKLETEISTDNTIQNSTEVNNSLNTNEDLQSLIDVNTSTQTSLETEQGVDNSFEAKTVANSTESSLDDEEEAAESLTRLEEISKNLKEENFTENDMTKVENYKTEIVGLINHFRDTKYYKSAQDVYNELLSLTKTLEVFKIANSIVNSNDTTEGLQYIETLRIKLDIIMNFFKNKNQFIIEKAAELKKELKIISDQIHNQNPEIPQELLIINKTYSNPENYNLKFLNEAKYNLTSIMYTLKTIESTKLANDLLRNVQILIYKIYQTQQELKVMENLIKIPSNDTELTKLNEYKQKLSALRTQPEPSIYKKAIELDETIKKVIKEYQIKAEINEVNLVLDKMNVSLEAAQSGNEINSNMMELKNLEMKIESLDVNEEDIEKIKQSIKQIQMENVRVAVRNDARVLYTIVNEFINVMKGTQSDIDNMNKQFLKLEQLNSSRFDLSSLNSRKNLIINDYNRIYRDLSDIRMRLEHFGFASVNNETLNQIRDLNDISEVLEFLSGLDHILKDSDTSKLYMKTFKNVQEVEQLRDAIKNIFKFMGMLEYFEKKKNLSDKDEEIAVNLGKTGSNFKDSDQIDDKPDSNLNRTEEFDSVHDEDYSSKENVENSEDNQANGHDMSSNNADSSKINENEAQTIDQNQSSNSESQSENFEAQPNPEDQDNIQK